MTNRDGRFLAYEITTMDYPSGDSFIRLTTGNRRSDVIRFAGKNIGPTLGLLTSILISGVTILNLPIDLLHFEEITHGRIHQRQMEYLPWICGSRYPNDLKLQVNF